jgi:hypothetical protein
MNIPAEQLQYDKENHGGLALRTAPWSITEFLLQIQVFSV